MILSAAFRLQERSGVAEVRRAALEHARWLGWDEVAGGNAAIVATELATNLVRHAEGGVVAITSGKPGNGTRLVLVATDLGPGMQDVERCFRDGYSTAGSDGSGLGAVSRLADSLDIVSSAQGTVLVAELRRPKDEAFEADFATGGFAVAKEGQDVSGDAWDCRMVDGVYAVLVCDGLGHGAYAAEASARAVEAFRTTSWRTAEEAVGSIHEALRPTRGAAAAVALIEAGSGSITYCGVGNISAAILNGGVSRHLVSHNGTLGHSAARISAFSYEWSAESALVLHSDGINSRWRPAQLETLWHRHPSLAAGVLYRDFNRGSDDAVVVVVRPA